MAQAVQNRFSRTQFEQEELQKRAKFLGSPLGLTLGTIKGLIPSAKKLLFEEPARIGGGAVLEGVKKLTGREMTFIPQTGIEKFVLGKELVKPLSQQGEDVLKAWGVSEENAKKFGPQAGLFLLGTELIPGGKQGKVAAKGLKQMLKPAILKALESLAQEARKYKSAEEFVKIKLPEEIRKFESTNVIYRAKDSSLGFAELGEGLYGAKNPAITKLFGSNMEKITINPTAKIIKEGNPEFESLIRASGGEPKLTRSVALARGIDGIKGIDPDTGTVIFNEKIIKSREAIGDAYTKTKSQLTDFYNQAVGEVKEIPQTNAPLTKLITAIKSAGKPRAELEKLYTIERSKRAGEISDIFAKQEGQVGFQKALGALKGELAPKKPSFEALKLDQGDVDDLARQIQGHTYLEPFEKISAWDGLRKILTGEIPQSNQLSLLEDVFGKEFAETILKKGPFKLKDFLVEGLNVPRTAITGLDASAVLRQAIILTTTRPTKAGKAFGEMFRQTFSQKNFEEWLKVLPEHPLYKEMKSSGLYIADPTRATGGLQAREEQFIGAFVKKIPFIGGLYRASERAFVSYLNKLRVDVFSQVTSQFQKQGIATPENLKSVAKFVNNASGRGDLPAFQRSATELSVIFFSPRLIAARFNMLNPIWYSQLTPPIRKEAVKTMAQFIGTGMSILGLIKLSGGKNVSVETDPRSTDFGKVRVGNTRWDMWGGFQQWVRVFTQLLTGERKTAKGEVVKLTGKEFPFESRLDVAERFIRGKLAPVPALALELAEGQKLFGEKLTIQSEVLENIIPLYLQDIGEAIREIGPEAILTAGIPAFFGVGFQVYQEKRAKNRFNR